MISLLEKIFKKRFFIMENYYKHVRNELMANLFQVSNRNIRELIHNYSLGPEAENFSASGFLRIIRQINEKKHSFSEVKFLLCRSHCEILIGVNDINANNINLSGHNISHPFFYDFVYENILILIWKEIFNIKSTVSICCISRE